jgi:hypothetical protein
MEAFDKTKFAIKNGHTKAQMSQLDDEWVNYKGPYLTLQQTFDLAKARQGQLDSEKSGGDEASDMIPRKAI